jgi:hypothetical protein
MGIRKHGFKQCQPLVALERRVRQRKPLCRGGVLDGSCEQRGEWID